MNMNKIMITGRLTRNIEVYNSEKTTVGNFTLANDTGYGDKKKTNFFKCVCFGKTVEVMEKYTSQGSKIIICGELQEDNYTDKNGNKRKDVKIIVNEVEFLEKKKE